MKSPLNSKGQMVLLLDSNGPQQCAYTDTTIASWLQTCDGGRRIHDLYFQNTSPLTADGLKKQFCYCLKREIVPKASHEHTWTWGVNGRHIVPCNFRKISAEDQEAASGFCWKVRVSWQTVWATGPSTESFCAGRGRERLDSNQLKL